MALFHSWRIPSNYSLTGKKVAIFSPWWTRCISLVERSETNNVREFMKVKKCTFYRLVRNFLSRRENFEKESTRILIYTPPFPHLLSYSYLRANFSLSRSRESISRLAQWVSSKLIALLQSAYLYRSIKRSIG